MTKGQTMMQHEPVPWDHVVPSYELDTLGAPFRVTLKDSVRVTKDPATGKELVDIPDLIGLTLAVVRCRVMDPRKLSGEEMRFLRRALGVPAKKLAAFLDLVPEHYSRCEAGTKVMSPNAERQLRLFAFGATLCGRPEKLLDRVGQQDAAVLKPRNKKSAQELSRFFFSVFMKMKIESVRSAETSIEYEFKRCLVDDKGCAGPDSDDDGDWTPLPLAA